MCRDNHVTNLHCLCIRGFLSPSVAVVFSCQLLIWKCCLLDVRLVLHSGCNFVFTFAKLHDAQPSSLFLVCRGQRWSTCQLLSTMWNWYLIPKSSGKEAPRAKDSHVLCLASFSSCDAQGSGSYPRRSVPWILLEHALAHYVFMWKRNHLSTVKIVSLED